jgi:hypothetical protein
MELYIKIKTDLYAKYADNYEGYDTKKDTQMTPLKKRAFEWGAKNL